MVWNPPLRSRLEHGINAMIRQDRVEGKRFLKIKEFLRPDFHYPGTIIITQGLATYLLLIVVTALPVYSGPNGYK